MRVILQLISAGLHLNCFQHLAATLEDSTTSSCCLSGEGHRRGHQWHSFSCHSLQWAFRTWGCMANFVSE